MPKLVLGQWSERGLSDLGCGRSSCSSGSFGVGRSQADRSLGNKGGQKTLNMIGSINEATYPNASFTFL